MKILCKFHEDTTPSMHVYVNDGVTYGFCFVCSKLVKLTDQDLGNQRPVMTVKAKTDIPTEIRRINNLPCKRIRGLYLPYDDKGYYVVWPDNDYYLRRNYSDKPRYTYPTGTRPPVFRKTCTNNWNTKDKQVTVIIEGQINLLSVLEACMGERNMILLSPGSAMNFNKIIVEKTSDVTIFCDGDVAGVTPAVALKERLLIQWTRARVIALTEDFNQILQDQGPEKLKQLFMEMIR